MTNLYSVFVQLYDKSNKNNKTMIGTKKFPSYGAGVIYSDRLDFGNLRLLSMKTEYWDGQVNHVSDSTEIDMVLFYFRRKSVNILIANEKEYYFETNVKLQCNLVKENVRIDGALCNEYKLTIT